MQVMQTRTKKGPSWADSDVLAKPSKLGVAENARDPKDEAPEDAKKVKKKEKRSKMETKRDHDGATATGGNDSPPLESASTEMLSDMDWFRQRTKTAPDEHEAPERAFEQSDEEQEEHEEVGAL